jgi:hypothetical protein
VRHWISLFGAASILTIFLDGNTEAWAYVTGGGGSGCFACGVPPELEPDAKTLRDGFSRESVEDLLDQQILGSICTNHECGELTEDQASRLLDRSLTAAQQVSQWWNAFWSWIVAGLGLVIAAGGLLISAIALRQSNRNEREIGQLQGQLDTGRGEMK